MDIRLATEADIPAIVRLLADDPLGAARETLTDPLPGAYVEAFGAIDRSPDHELMVAEDAAGLAGCLQLSFLPCMTHGGRWRAQIEGVRVRSDSRGAGVGRALFERAIDRARERDVHVVQLTTDKARPDALRFYERLGFIASHEGMKLKLG